MSRCDLSVKGGTSERCYRTRRGRTDEQRYAIISPYFDGRIKMNGPYPEITNISFLAKLFFKTFISLKHLSDYRTVRLSDRRTIGLSDYRIVELSDSDYSYGPVSVICVSCSYASNYRFLFNIFTLNMFFFSKRQKDKTQVKQLRQSFPITYISKYTIEHNNI